MKRERTLQGRRRIESATHLLLVRLGGYKTIKDSERGELQGSVADVKALTLITASATVDSTATSLSMRQVLKTGRSAGRWAWMCFW